jgi:hypothetical protein
MSIVLGREDLLDGFNIPADWAGIRKSETRSEPAGANEIAFNIPVLENERDEQIQALLSARFGAEGETIWLRQLQFAVWKII